MRAEEHENRNCERDENQASKRVYLGLRVKGVGFTELGTKLGLGLRLLGLRFTVWEFVGVPSAADCLTVQRGSMGSVRGPGSQAVSDHLLRRAWPGVQGLGFRL